MSRINALEGKKAFGMSGVGMETGREIWFDHEKLDVYQEAIGFIAWVTPLIEVGNRMGDVRDQLERASTSIALNIAEGNGKFSPKDRCKYFDVAHGSALECAAALDVLVARRRLSHDQIRAGKEKLQRTVRMLFGLIKRISDRNYPTASANDSSSSSSSSSSS